MCYLSNVKSSSYFYVQYLEWCNLIGEFEVKVIIVAIPLCARMRKLAFRYRSKLQIFSSKRTFVLLWIHEWTKHGSDLTLNVKRQSDLGKRLITHGDKESVF